jgi:hypothetical protein
MLKKYGWKNDLQTIFDKNDFMTIIICDKNQIIIRVKKDSPL